jgi:hypothetical protein
MATRPSSRSRASSVSKAPPAHASNVSRAIVYHGTAVTLLSVISLFLFLGIALALCAFVARMERIESILASQGAVLSDLQVQQPLPPQDLKPLPVDGAPVTSEPVSPAQPSSSPSGKLHRGSFSPDGTKYAGYEETTKGKIGIAVETIDGGRIRYIVIFNAFTESTGAGSDLANALSVRWIDNQTIEYDVLVTRGGTQTTETEQVRIFF